MQRFTRSLIALGGLAALAAASPPSAITSAEETAQAQLVNSPQISAAGDMMKNVVDNQAPDGGGFTFDTAPPTSAKTAITFDIVGTTTTVNGRLAINIANLRRDSIPGAPANIAVNYTDMAMRAAPPTVDRSANYVTVENVMGFGLLTATAGPNTKVLRSHREYVEPPAPEVRQTGKVAGKRFWKVAKHRVATVNLARWSA